ncbi:HesB/YadR/YfhF family protein [Alicyclobacillus curvatus]|nr:HesB/YadR/YfhF family protein [Alicyclobacillus curvatus]
MHIDCDKKALQWFRSELGVGRGDAIRFFVKYGGDGAVHPGFSLGISVEPPKNVAAEAELDGIRLFIRDEDAWYFDNRDLTIMAIADEVEYLVG